MNNVSLDRKTWWQVCLEKIQQFTPNPKPVKWWYDPLWIVILAILQEVILPTFLPAWIHLDLLTTWLIFNVITSHTKRIVLIYVLSATTLESMSSVPAGFYWTVYLLPVVVIPLIRCHLTWSFYTPWFVSFSAALFWVHGFKYFVQAVLADQAELSVFSVIFIFSAVTFGTMIGSLVSKPYQTSEFFVREGII